MGQMRAKTALVVGAAHGGMGDPERGRYWGGAPISSGRVMLRPYVRLGLPAERLTPNLAGSPLE